MRALALILTSLVAGCATSGVVAPAGTACVTESFQVTDQFAGARRGTCRVLGKNKVMLEIRREDDKVTNPSPWYAFKLVPIDATTAIVLLDYATWKHRYRPKISYDGIYWRALDEDDIDIIGGGMRARIRVALGDQPVWVAAQELILPAIYDVWLRKMDHTTAAKMAELGRSRADLPIYQLESNPASKEAVLMIGRQHPPEVSGTFAFMSFVETLLGDTKLASDFRERFRIVGIPLLNPDGVVGGNWRHNLGSADLNRDWGLFAQPETRLVSDLLDNFDDAGVGLRAFIDFHSTAKNVFYTQVAGDVTNPPNFVADMLAAAKPRLVDYPFSNTPSPTSNETVSKNYIYLRYGIPAFTYEVGDETNRGAVVAAAVVLAEEFMKLMLRQ